ncbi:barstar family protein [Aeromicrobium alkaliterrae]|uniref:Barstar (barnase inhibitor) domain-containing protein n=1 Tax=Aeromicrobium alkaliterrae TaxID=302168 RepID=A0ABN2JS55_9ACTN
MERDIPWVRGELPWLGGPLYRVRDSAWPVVHEFLKRHDYRLIVIDGTAMKSSEAAHEVLQKAFGFPDWYGRNWDAFSDCFEDFAGENVGKRVAIVWRDIETAGRVDPATTAEVGWGLLDCAFRSSERSGRGDGDSIVVDVFAIGGGDEFASP